MAVRHHARAPVASLHRLHFQAADAGALTPGQLVDLVKAAHQIAVARLDDDPRVRGNATAGCRGRCGPCGHGRTAPRRAEAARACGARAESSRRGPSFTTPRPSPMRCSSAGSVSTVLPRKLTSTVAWPNQATVRRSSGQRPGRGGEALARHKRPGSAGSLSRGCSLQAQSRSIFGATLCPGRTIIARAGVPGRSHARRPAAGLASVGPNRRPGSRCYRPRLLPAGRLHSRRHRRAGRLDGREGGRSPPVFRRGGQDEPRAWTRCRAGVLVISQFTLYGDAAKGRRPSFIDAARPEMAIPLYERFLAALRVDGDSRSRAASSAPTCRSRSTTTVR